MRPSSPTSFVTQLLPCSCHFPRPDPAARIVRVQCGKANLGLSVGCGRWGPGAFLADIIFVAVAIGAGRGKGGVEGHSRSTGGHVRGDLERRGKEHDEGADYGNRGPTLVMRVLV